MTRPYTALNIMVTKHERKPPSRAAFLLTMQFLNVRMNKSPSWDGALHGGSRRSALPEKEVLLMVTYSDLIQIGILLVGICSLVLQISKKK